MSAEAESALTPEEWRLRGFSSVLTAKTVGIPEHWNGRPAPALFLTPENVLASNMYADTGDWGDVLDPRKVMALANLALTLQQSEHAITQEHVDLCTAAAWYFRRSVATTAPGLKEATQSAANGLTALARMLRALVPPAE